MRLSKYHGLGNDFLLVDDSDCRQSGWDLPGLARQLCDRHYGVGADGLVPIAAGRDGADCQVRIFNSDGSEAEISGNGVRCAAAQWFRTRKADSAEVRIGTAAGVKKLELLEQDGNTSYFASWMGQPRFRPEEIPIRVPEPLDEVLDYALPVGGSTVRLTAVSMGNPHCSVFVDAIDDGEIERVGKLLESHSVFPQKTNVEFIRVLEPGKIRVWFWERGVGRTLSSGTGSCGSALAAIRNGHAGDRVCVVTDSGSMQVTWRPGQSVRLDGPAELVCDVEVYLPRQTFCWIRE